MKLYYDHAGSNTAIQYKVDFIFIYYKPFNTKLYKGASLDLAIVIVKFLFSTFNDSFNNLAIIIIANINLKGVISYLYRGSAAFGFVSLSNPLINGLLFSVKIRNMRWFVNAAGILFVDDKAVSVKKGVLR